MISETTQCPSPTREPASTEKQDGLNQTNTKLHNRVSQCCRRIFSSVWDHRHEITIGLGCVTLLVGLTILDLYVCIFAGVILCHGIQGKKNRREALDRLETIRNETLPRLCAFKIGMTSDKTLSFKCYADAKKYYIETTQTFEKFWKESKFGRFSPEYLNACKYHDKLIAECEQHLTDEDRHLNLTSKFEAMDDASTKKEYLEALRKAQLFTRQVGDYFYTRVKNEVDQKIAFAKMILRNDQRTVDWF